MGRAPARGLDADAHAHAAAVAKARRSSSTSTGSPGLRRRDRAQSGGRVLYLDAAPVYARIVERMRWLPEQDDDDAQARRPARRASSGCC